MKGQILDYSIQKSEGLITSKEGSRYKFNGSEWKGDVTPIRGLWVDFEGAGDTATAVFLALTAGTRPNSTVRPGDVSKGAMTLWGVFLGGFGAQKFYIGSWGWGIVYLVTCWLYIPFIVALVEWIRIVLMTDDEFYSKMTTFENSKPGPFGFFW